LGAAVAVALISTSAFAVAPFGNNTQRGSLLFFPRIEVGVNNTSDTLITMINDFGYGQPVLLKCYYLAPGANYYDKKLVKDFTKQATSNQPIFWWASTGKTVGFGATGGTTVIPVKFSPFPPTGGIGNPSLTRSAGELKCWAINESVLPIHFNHLSGTGSIVKASGQAMEYNAFAFEALDGGRTTANTGNKVAGTTAGLPNQLGCLRQLGFRARRDGYLAAGLGQGECNGSAKSPAAARDQGCPIRFQSPLRWR